MSPEHIGFLITVMGLLGIMVWRERRITLLEGELKKREIKLPQSQTFHELKKRIPHLPLKKR